MKRTVSMYEAKAHLSRVVMEVERTRQRVTITRHNKPVVDIVAHVEPADPLKQEPSLEGARFLADPCAPVDPADWPPEQR